MKSEHVIPVLAGSERDADGRLSAQKLRELAAMPHVLCKVSGLVTEVVGDTVEEAVLRRYLDTALELFGPRRLLFGSDWPVCLLRASYAKVACIVEQWSRELGAEDEALIRGGNAVRCYGLPLGVSTSAESPQWT